MNITDALVRQIFQLYLDAVKEVVNQAVAAGAEATEDDEFQFANYPGLEKKVNKILLELSAKIAARVGAETATAWMRAEVKNDKLVKKLFGDKLPEALEERFLGRNLQALRRFQDRKTNGLNLSERIWQTVEPFKKDLEQSLDLGILDGRPASQIARDIKASLKEPNRLFRRVRDARGRLALSKEASNYHPGQGIYRSSYKNAERVARTEINFAYRSSDWERWQRMPFIIGIEIRRSNNPYPCDICASLAGIYPKDFLFPGWHPNCRCDMLAVIASDSDMDKFNELIMQGRDPSEYKPAGLVKGMPAVYNEWINKNKKRLLGAKNAPYFIKFNYKDGKLGKGLQFSA